MKRLFLQLAFTCSLVAGDGSVAFSDGSEISGTVTLGNDLRLNTGNDWVQVPATRVRAIALTVEHEELAASWRFPIPGSPRKELVGQPYPTRSFSVEVTLAGGERLKGHLYPLAVLVAGREETRKVSLLSKQVGKPGGRLDTLVYPLRITIPGPAEEATAQRLHLPAGATALGLVVLPWLTPMTLSGDALPGPVTPPVVLAARHDAGITVAWPGDDAALRARLEPTVAAVPDFPDERLVVAAWHDGDADTALLRLRRVGSSTGDAAAKPWRVEVWRFRTDPVSGGGVLAARGLLARGTGEAPTVRISTAWWQQRLVSGVIEVGP